jgi:hypothetical protein
MAMNDQSSTPVNPMRGLSPSQFYRRKHPELFSDSRRATETALTREVLSYHLETLTSQKLESAFEVFAVRLVEKFIAPNLRPQTGPVGGGDGKTDAETYPVSEAISQRWFWADSKAGNEWWAFAFSAKRDWRAKVRSDVSSIAGTRRGYQRIYFITNQLVSAKKSVEVQDALSRTHAIPLTILDRTWLLNCVFERDSIDIAAKTLGVGTDQASTVIGPRDLERETRLAQLERAIGDGSQYQGMMSALVEDALHAAELVRGLERPRHEIEGAYSRAIRLAQSHSLRTHELRAAYGFAWTSYFWFNDAIALNRLYDDVEKLAIRSSVADELEKLSNLLTLLVGAVARGELDANAAALAKRRTTLIDALEHVRRDHSKPNNALHAHSLALTVQVTQIVSSGDQAALDPVWRQFIALIKQAEGLGTFPFQTLAEALTQIGDFVPESEAFDHLYEVLTDAMATRKGEGEAARKNSERGFQKLKKKLAYDAIRWFGRAVGLLIKEEYRDELVEALVGSSVAYSHVGLHWAARNYALAAVTNDASEFARTKTLDNITPATLSQMFDCELALRRVPFTLIAYELGAMVRNGRSRTDEQRKLSDERRIEQGNHFGALLLGTTLDDLRRIAKLPDALGRLGLQQARAALLFLMGHEHAMRAEGSIPEDATPEDIEELFGKWAALAKRAGLTNPDYMLDGTAVLRSRLLGCEIVATCENKLTSIAVGEALLGALEALLATSLKQRVMAHREKLSIRVFAGSSAQIVPILRMVEERGEDIVVVTHPPQIHRANREEVQLWFEWLQEAAVKVFTTFAVAAAPEEWAQKIFGDESGLSRAIGFSDVPGMYGVIFGSAERLSINKWIDDEDFAYEVKRLEPWHPSLAVGDEASDESIPPKLSDGPAPTNIFDEHNLRHTDFRVDSPIDLKKWGAAKWHAAFFMTQPGGTMPPVLGLAFKNREPARLIFQGWRERFGEQDSENKLRISILTGARRSNPHAYAVVVGPNMKGLDGGSGRVVGFVSRILVMEPSSSKNLAQFLAEYNRHKFFRLIPAYMANMTAQPDPMLDLVLQKYHLGVRPAWQVSDNDPDMMALDLDDPPVIPIEESNAPVLGALRQLARIRAREPREDPSGKLV